MLITYFYYDSPSKYDFLLNLPTRQWSRGRHERDHIGGRVSCIDIITPDLTENAEYVNEAWRTASQSRLAGIFQTGRRLIEIRDRYIDPATGMARAKADEGKCSRLIGDNQWSGQSGHRLAGRQAGSRAPLEPARQRVHILRRNHYLQRTGKLFPLKCRKYRPVFGKAFPYGRATAA